MEEVIEGLLRPLLRLVALLVRAAIWLVWELWFEIIAWYVGWPVVRSLTLWRLPREGIKEHDEASTLTLFLVGCVGIAVLLGLAAVLAPLVVNRT